jgi:hypothetical protein
VPEILQPHVVPIGQIGRHQGVALARTWGRP